jgi:hypothetical protein
MDARGLLCAALSAATAFAAAGAQAEPARRGPTIPVIRPSLSAFPDRVRTGLSGPIGVQRVAALAWVGPRLDDEWRPDLAADNSTGWMRGSPDAWERLRAEQDRGFLNATEPDRLR